MIRSRTASYVAAACVLIAAVWGIAYAAVSAERDRSLAQSAEKARSLAIFFESHALSIFHYADVYLRAARRTFLQQGGVGAVRSLLDEVPLNQSAVSHITIIDAAGIPVFNSGHTLKPDINVRDRDYFNQQRTTEGDQAFISLPKVGRNSGKLVIRLVRRIDEPDGAFGGVIFAAMEADKVTEFFATMNLGPKSSATLVGTDKRIRARSSYGRLGPGQDISGSRIWRELERSPVGLYRQTSVVDGITRHYAYRRLEDFPLIVAIGVSVEDIATTVSRFQIPAYLTASLATVIIAVVTVLLARETLTSRKLAAQESQLRQIRDELEIRVRERTAELEAVQHELIRNERLAVLGQLTGTVAHELRNPLGTIVTGAAILERSRNDPHAPIEPALERIRRSVERCDNIITELLDFARATGLDPAPTPLDPWMSEFLDEMEAATGFALARDLQAGSTVVAFDRDRVRRAIINLVDNARDAAAQCPPDTAPEVRVATRALSDRVEIEVVDNGPGIAEDLEDRIFEPLFSTKSFGIGLGLPVVKRVAEEHGGTFRITSDAGRGTRAVLTLALRGDHRTGTNAAWALPES